VKVFNPNPGGCTSTRTALSAEKETVIMGERRQNEYYFLLVFAILLGGSLRFYQIGGQPLWLDEAFSDWFSSRTIRELWSIIPQFETNPPLYYTILKIWRSLFGSSEAGLRSLSAVMSVGCIFLVFMLGRLMGKSIGGNWVGAIAALLFSVSTVHIQYAQEARPYAMLTFATTLTLCSFLWIMRNPAEACEPIIRKPVDLKLYSKNGMGRAKFLPWLTITVAIAFTLWLHNTAVLYIFTLSLIMLAWFLFELRLNRTFLGNMMIAGSVAVLLWAPYLVFLIPQTKSANLPIAEPTALSIVNAISWLLFGISISSAIFAKEIVKFIIFFILIILAASGLWNIRKRSGKYISVLILASIFGPILMVLLFSLIVRPIFVERTLIYVSVPFYIAISAGIMMLRDPRKRALVVIIISLIFLKWTHSYYTDYHKEPWDRVVQTVTQYGKGDVVLLLPNNIELPFSYYAKRNSNNNLQIIPLPFPWEDFLHPALHVDRSGSNGFKAAQIRSSDIPSINTVIAKKSPLWLITRREDLFDPDRLAFNALMQNRDIISTWHFQEISVIKFN